MGDVTLDGITKRYGDVTAVDDMHLDIEDGEFVTFVGPSGCGKSTTLETIAGLTMPTDGSVTIAGRDVTDLPPKDRGIAMVFQNIALFPHMDVFDNVSFGLRIRKYDSGEIDRRVERAAEVVQLEGMLDRMPTELSGGQRQRVAIARAIVREPEVFLMDEPLANLDAKLRVHMRTELQRLHKELGTTIIYVTHDQAEAMTMSDRIAVIDGGELQQIAPPLTCYNEPANRFVAEFIGSPSMNVIDAVAMPQGLSNDVVTLEFDHRAVGVEDGAEVAFGVRPEDVYLAEHADTVTAPSEVVTMRTDVTEPMGDQVFVYLTPPETDEAGMDATESREQLLMSVDPDADVAEDETLDVVLDRSRVHLFDGHSGAAIAHGLVDGAGRTAPTEEAEEV